MKVMITYPPLEGKGCPMLGQNRQFQWFHNPSYIYPMVPASAATLLKQKGYDVVWLDCIAEKKTYAEFIEAIKNEKPDLIAIETKTPIVKQHWKIIDDLKNRPTGNRQPATVLMGDHVTALPLESMESSPVAYCITGGDYDFSLLSVCDNISTGKPLASGVWYRENGRIKNTGPFTLNSDLNSLPFVDRKLTKWHLYGERLYKRTPFTYTMAGRDCPWAKCTFCSWTTLYPKFRVCRPDRLLDEIGLLLEDCKIREIFDDTGTFPAGGWLESFCRGMIKRGLNKRVVFDCNFRFDYLKPGTARLMKEAGFRLMKLGLESANQRTLDRLNKNTKAEDIAKGCRIAKEAGLDVHLTMMVGYPWETRQEAYNTLNLARSLMKRGYADMLQSTIPIPYPGTPLFEEAVRNNWLRFDPEAYEKFDMAEPIFKTPDMEPHEIMKVCDEIYKSFLHPYFIFHHLKRVRSAEDIAYLARGLKPVIGHIKDFMRIRK